MTDTVTKKRRKNCNYIKTIKFRNSKKGNSKFKINNFKINNNNSSNNNNNKFKCNNSSINNYSLNLFFNKINNYSNNNNNSFSKKINLILTKEVKFYQKLSQIMELLRNMSWNKLKIKITY